MLFLRVRSDLTDEELKVSDCFIELDRDVRSREVIGLVFTKR